MNVYVVFFSNGCIYGIYKNRETALADGKEAFEKMIKHSSIGDNEEWKKRTYEDDFLTKYVATRGAEKIEVEILLMEVDAH